MDFIKIIISILITFFGYYSRYPDKTKVRFSFLLLISSLFLNAVFFENFLLQIATFAEIISVSTLAGVIFKKNKSEGKNRSFAFKILILLLTVLAIHNFYDIFILQSKDLKEGIYAINPWGLMISLILIFGYTSNGLYKYINNRFMLNTFQFSSILLVLLIFMIQLGLIAGNVSKLETESGGIGLKNLSTNETGLIALSFLIFVLNFSRIRNKYGVFSIAAIVSDIIVIVLTRSRVCLISLIVIIIFYFANAVRRYPIQAIFTGLISFIFALPLIDQLVSMYLQRFENDQIDVDVVTLSDNLGFTISGRTLIWEAYLTQFFTISEQNYFFYFFGTGYHILTQLYKKSFLSLIGFSLEKVDFFPLHSDLVLLFITCGGIGLLIWILLVRNLILAFKKKPAFIMGSFIWILILFSFMDMLNYSPLASLLIGTGLSFKNCE